MDPDTTYECVGGERRVESVVFADDEGDGSDAGDDGGAAGADG